jgi:hypothetical protein
MFSRAATPAKKDPGFSPEAGTHRLLVFDFGAAFSIPDRPSRGKNI